MHVADIALQRMHGKKQTCSSHMYVRKETFYFQCFACLKVQCMHVQCMNTCACKKHMYVSSCIYLQEEAVQYVATTVDRLLREQQQQGLKRVYVISTYVIGKERLLVAIYKLTGCRIGVTQEKMDTMKCLDLPGILFELPDQNHRRNCSTDMLCLCSKLCQSCQTHATEQVPRCTCHAGVDLKEVFTTDLASTPVHVAKWGFLGESWPFFRPNFVNMEQYKTDMNVDEVRH